MKHGCGNPPGDRRTAVPTAIRHSPGADARPAPKRTPQCPIQSEIDVVPPSGKPIGLTTKRASRKRPNPCRNPISAGPAPSLYVLYGPCSSVPASGCHHRPVPDDRTGSPEQALNLFLLVVSPSGTRKTRTKFAFTLSGRSADNLETPRLARAFPDAINLPTATYQSPTIPHRKGADFQ